MDRGSSALMVMVITLSRFYSQTTPNRQRRQEVWVWTSCSFVLRFRTMGLRDIRLEHVLTQDELAAKAGVSNKTIVELEAGRTQPHQQTIRKLAAAFGISARELARLLK